MKYGLIILVAALFTGAAWLATPTRSCANGYCPEYPCFGGDCGTDCMCIMPPGSSSSGECYGVSQSDQLLEQGWTRF